MKPNCSVNSKITHHSCDFLTLTNKVPKWKMFINGWLPCRIQVSGIYWLLLQLPWFSWVLKLSDNEKLCCMVSQLVTAVASNLWLSLPFVTVTWSTVFFVIVATHVCEGYVVNHCCWWSSWVLLQTCDPHVCIDQWCWIVLLSQQKNVFHFLN